MRSDLNIHMANCLTGALMCLVVLSGCVAPTPVLIRERDPRDLWSLPIEASILTEDTISKRTNSTLMRLGITQPEVRDRESRRIASEALIEYAEQHGTTADIRVAIAELLLALYQPLRPNAARSMHAAWLVWPVVASESVDEFAVALHREATARILWDISHGAITAGQRLTFNKQVYVVPGYETEPGTWFEDVPPDLVVRSDTLEVQGVTERHITFGYGATAVGFWESTEDRRERHPFLPLEGSIEPLTAALWYGSGPGVYSDRQHQIRPRLVLHSPRRSSEHAPTIHSMSADWTAAISYLMASSDLQARGVRGMTSVSREIERFGLFLVEPYDPDRIPVVFVHGLRSNPLTWREAYTTILSDPELRATYQPWFFMYPTGLPVLVSAERLRSDLELVKLRYDPDGTHIASSDMIVVGHSMGGLLARTLVQDSGETLWKVKRTRPLDEFELSDDTRDYVRRIFFFEPVDVISRVVFIASPLRGASMADSWLGELGTLLVSLPEDILEKSRELNRGHVDDVPWSERRSWQWGVPTSIEDLETDSPYNRAFNLIPIVDGVEIHTIIGDRGSTRDERWPEGTSDGVVAYWSSRIEEAESELIVPSSHNAHQHPEGVAELMRILRLHRRQHLLQGRIPL